MSTLSTTPSGVTILTLQARKSFQLALWIKNEAGHAVDITGTTIRMVARKNFPTTDDGDVGNLISSDTAEIVEAGQGFAILKLQASDLDWPAGEYPFVVVMVVNGYSSVIITGVINLEPNTEYASVDDTYTDGTSSHQLMVLLRDQAVVQVYAGHALLPGTTSFSITDKDKLDGIEAGAQVNINPQWINIVGKPTFGTAAEHDLEDIAVPLGGTPGEILTKYSATDGDYGWSQPIAGGGGGSGLDATGVLINYVPTSDGAGSWGWEPLPPSTVSSINGFTGEVELDLGDLSDTLTRIAMTPAERAKLADLTLEWSALLNVPLFGTASLKNEGDFLPVAGISGTKIISGIVAAAYLPRLVDIRGFTPGTAAPAGGTDGDFYYQFDA